MKNSKQTDQPEQQLPQELFETLFHNLPDAVFIHPFKEEGFRHFIEVNRTACERYGYTRDEFKRLSLSDINVTADLQKQTFRQTRDNLARKGESIFETEHITKNGRRFPVEIHSIIFHFQGQKAILSIVRDISDRKINEQKLKDSEERFRLTFYTSPDSINLNRLKDGMYVDVNQGFCEITGYTREEVIGKTSFEINIWADLNDRDRLVDRLQKDGRVNNFKAKFRMKDGTVITGLMSASIIHLHGEPHVITITRNIEHIKQLERKQEKLLAETEKARKLLSDVFGRISDGVVALDKNWRYTYLNTRAAKMLNREKPEDLLGKHIWTEYPEGVGQPFYKAYIKAMETQQTVYLQEYFAPWGRWFENRIYPSPEGLTIYFTDISEQKQAELALEHSEKLFNETQRIAHIGSWELDLKHNTLYWSDEIYRLFELPKEKFGATYEAFLNAVHPDDREMVNRAYTESVKNRTPYKIEHRLLMADGRVKWVQEQCETFYDKDGTPLRSVGTVLDITERKQAEQALINSEARYRYLFENSPIPLWEEDFSALLVYLKELEKSGIKRKSLRSYLEQHPDVLQKCVDLIEVLNVNQAAVILYQAKNKKELLGSLLKIFTPNSIKAFKEGILTIAEGKALFESEAEVMTLKGEPRTIYLRIAIRSGSTLSHAVVATPDITNLKRTEKELQRSQARLSVLHRLDSAILQARSVAEIAYAALDSLTNLIPAGRISIVVFSQDMQQAVVYSHGALEDEIGRERIIPVKGSFHDMEGLLAGKIAQIPDLNELKDTQNIPARLKKAGLRSLFKIPIRAEETLLGSLNVAFKQPNAFNNEQIAIGKEVADSIGIALLQAQLHEDLRKHAGKLEKSLAELKYIHQLSQRMDAASNRKEIAKGAIQLLRKALKPDIILFYLREGDKLNLLAQYTGHTSFEIDQARHHQVGECLCGLAAKGGKPVFSLRIQTDMRCTLNEYKNAGLASFAGLPLVIGEKVIGVIGLGSLSERDFAQQKSFLQTLMNEVSISLQNILLLQELRQHEQELEERVAQRTAELLRANEELESFSYSVSHDLRAPLRAIDGFSRILAEDYGFALDDEAKRLIGVIRSNTQHMGQLIDDLLLFSRAGRQAINRSKVNMAGLVEAIYYELTTEDRRKNIEFTIAALPDCFADASLMRQVWNNLISNALKFSAHKKKPRIKVGFKEYRDRIEFFIQDNGAGFDMKYADMLFKIFQRLHSSEEFPGTGVGLSIVKRIIERHGGKVWAKGTPNRGATFYFSLPKENL